MSNTLKTAMLLGVLSALLLLIGEALGGAQGLVLGFIFAAVTNFASYWFSDKIVLRMYSARDDDRRGGNPIALIATIILAPIAAMLIQMAISRSREYDADAGGAAITGSPDGLVSALQKLETASKVVPLDANPATAHMFIIKPFTVSGLAGLFSSHPPTADRIAALLHA